VTFLYSSCAAVFGHCNFRRSMLAPGLANVSRIQLPFLVLWIRLPRLFLSRICCLFHLCGKLFNTIFRWKKVFICRKVSPSSKVSGSRDHQWSVCKSKLHFFVYAYVLHRYYKLGIGISTERNPGFLILINFLVACERSHCRRFPRNWPRPFCDTKTRGFQCYCSLFFFRNPIDIG